MLKDNVWSSLNVLCLSVLEWWIKRKGLLPGNPFWLLAYFFGNTQFYLGIHSCIRAFKVLSWHSKFYLSHLVGTNPLLHSNSSINVDFFPSFDCTITYFAFSPSVFLSGKCCNEPWIDLKVLTLLIHQVFSLMGKRQVLLVSRPQQFIDFSIPPFL